MSYTDDALRLARAIRAALKGKHCTHTADADEAVAEVLADALKDEWQAGHDDGYDRGCDEAAEREAGESI